MLSLTAVTLFFRTRKGIATTFGISAIVCMLPFFLVLSPGIDRLQWLAQTILPGPILAGLFGYMYGPKLNTACEERSRIGGANVGVRVAFCAWVVYAVLISIPLSHGAGAEFSWRAQLVRSLSSSLMISAVALPLVCIIGGIAGTLYVILACRSDNNCGETNIQTAARSGHRSR